MTGFRQVFVFFFLICWGINSATESAAQALETSPGFAKIIFDPYFFTGVLPRHTVDWSWEINQYYIVRPTRDTLAIPVNKSGFDTVLFARPHQPAQKVITRFREGGVYRITYHLCCDGFDLRLFEDSLVVDSLGNEIQSPTPVKEGTVQFQVTGFQGRDTLAGVFGDVFSGCARGVLLKPDQVTDTLLPFRTAYSDYIHHLAVVQLTRKKKKETDDPFTGVYLPGETGEDPSHFVRRELASAEFRLLHGEHLLLTWNHRKQELEIQLK